MDISLTKASLEDASALHRMQVRSFQALLDKYQDLETNPAAEPLEKVIWRINQSFTDYYIINKDDCRVGGIRIIKMKDRRYRVSPVFVLPEYQGQGIAQKVFHLIEEIYSDARFWELETIMLEQGNCHLYEKLGYKKTGQSEVINSKMTLIGYEKPIGI